MRKYIQGVQEFRARLSLLFAMLFGSIRRTEEKQL